MKLSVFNPVLGDMPFESAMQYLAQCGVDAVEIGCGGYPGKAHCDPALLLEDEGTLSAFKRVLKKNGLELAALSAHGVEKIALEMHPGFCVYNPETLLRLRKAVGPLIGANFDPSHLFWQGIDPVAAIRRLGDAIYFVHAKDTRLDPLNGPVNGMLDTKRFTCEQERSWLFRTVGYGHDALVWKDIVSNLRLAGYDDVLSIEHEDSLMSPREGLEKAIAFLRGILMYDSKNNDVFWA